MQLQSILTNCFYSLMTYYVFLYRIQNLDQSCQGTYICQAYGPWGQAQASAQLVVQGKMVASGLCQEQGTEMRNKGTVFPRKSLKCYEENDPIVLCLCLA